jgi:hypothetical protein
MKTGKKLAEFDRGTDFMGKIFVGDDGLLSTADSGRFKLRRISTPASDAARHTGARDRAHDDESQRSLVRGEWLGRLGISLVTC